MERNYQRQGLVNVLALLAVGAAGFAVARYANSLAGQIGAAYIGMGFLVALVGWFQMRLEERERLERFELEDLARSKASAALFEAREAELFPAQRSRQQFERYFVPIFTVLLFLLQLGGAYVFWRWLNSSVIVLNPARWMVAAALFATFFLVLFILGRFSATIARLEDHRLLRPGASYLLLGAFLCALSAVGVATASVSADWPKADYYAARVFCVLLAVIAAETLGNLILEIYRPRMKGKVARPLYESRLVGLLGQPEGLITTAAQALDYQFGFKVSETWFYRFFEKALVWLILLQTGVLLLSTTVVFIEQGEQGLLERFGKLGGAVLEPGAHLKLPWPVDRVYRFPTSRIQSFNVGFESDPDHAAEKTVLWTVAHTKEENFLVANRDQLRLTATNNAEAKRSPPVSLLAVSCPVQFHITNVLQWTTNNANAPQALKALATREVVRYFVSADFNEIMSSGRSQASDTLRNRIQAAANVHQLGTEILFVGVQDIHPPVKIAADYEKVTGAIQKKEASILAARAAAIATNALAEGQAFKTERDAEAYQQRVAVRAAAQAAAFTNQIPAYRAAPAVYTERAYLQTLVRATAQARKYVLLTTNAHNVITYDLQDKIRPGDLEGNITAPPPKK